MKILFLNPSRAGSGNIPINIPLLIAVLRNKGHIVKLFDFSDYQQFDHLSEFENRYFKPAPINNNKIIADRRLFYGSKFSLRKVGTKLRTTDIEEDFVNILHSFKPDFLAVSCLTVDYSSTCEFLHSFRYLGIPTIFGGIHAILNPKEVLQSGVCDYVCIGEGENVFPKWLDGITKEGLSFQIPGIISKAQILESGDLIYPSLTNLNDLPPIDIRDFDPIHFYRPFDGKRYKMLNYEFGRGCPYKCSYCVNITLQEKYRGAGKYCRMKNPEKAISELRQLVDQHKFEFIRFWDEDFSSHTLEVLYHFKKLYCENINLPFLVYARVESINEEKVLLLKEMGCRTCAMGIESGNPAIRKHILNRNMTNQLIIDKFNLVKNYGIRTSAYNMIGLPFETRETIFDTIRLNRKVKPSSFSVTLLEPYKGTPIRQLCEEEGLPPDHQVSWNKVQFVPRAMTMQGLMGLYRTFPLYVRLDESLWPQVEKAETDNNVFEKLLREYPPN